MVTNEKKYTLKNVLTAARKLSVKERQLLRLKLFSSDVLDEMKTFESKLKKQQKKIPKKSDDEVVQLTSTIRHRKYANSKKMLH